MSVPEKRLCSYGCNQIKDKKAAKVCCYDCISKDKCVEHCESFNIGITYETCRMNEKLFSRDKKEFRNG